MRKVCKYQPDESLLAIKKEQLALLEAQSKNGNIALYYGDESSVSESAYVPYAWQFEDEKVAIAATHGQRINCFGLISRANDFIFKTTTKSIDANFIVDFFDEISLKIKQKTVFVLDNASIHVAQKVKERLSYWQNRGLHIFYLPPYSPHLNSIERVWKELKARWLKPQDYLSFDNLCYYLNQCLSQVGNELTIKYSDYS